MGNKILGEITAKDAAGNAYTLCLDFNALCFLEELAGPECITILENIGNQKCTLRFLRHVMTAALQKHHKGATEEIAGDILSCNVNVIVDLIAASMPEAAEAANTASVGECQAAAVA